MIIFFLLLFFGDDNTLYLMDESFSLFPAEEEFLFNHNINNFRTTQGCLDLYKWYQRYEAKVRMPLFSNLVMDYDFYKEDDYDICKEIHSFKLRWLPEEKGSLPLSFSFIISPDFLKKNDFVGLGIGFWKSESNNHFLNLVVDDFDHNYALYRKKGDSLKDPYQRFPIALEFQGNVHDNWADLTYKYLWTFPGKKDFRLDNELIGKGKYGEKSLMVSSRYRLTRSLSMGLHLRYFESDSSYISYTSDDNYHLNWERGFAEPYLRLFIFGENNLYIGLPMDWKRIKSDSLNYRRKWIGITILYKYRLWNWFTIPVGFQNSWRELNVKDNEETRGVLGLEFRFKKRTYFAIQEGIEMDSPLSNILRNPHNHTFVMLYHKF